MNKEFYKTSTSIGALLVLIGFVLPWYSMGIMSISGYDIPKMAEIGKNIADTFSRNDSDFSLYKLYYLLYLLPVFSLYLLYCEYSQTTKFKSICKLSIPILLFCFLIFYIVQIKHITTFFKFLGYGFVITLAGSTYLGIQAYKEYDMNPKILLTFIKNLQKTISNWLIQNRKKIIIGFTLILISSISFFIFYKNSYDKLVIAFENQNWQEVKVKYMEVNSDLADGKIKLDSEERNKLETLYNLSSKLQLIEEFKQKLDSADKKNLDSFFSLNDLWSELPKLNNDLDEAENSNIDISQVKKAYFKVNDDFKLSFAETILDNSYDGLLNEKNIEDRDRLMIQVNSYVKNLIEQVSDKQNTTAKNRINLINKKLSEYKQKGLQLNKSSASATFNLEPFSFTGKEGDFDNGYSENKQMFESKKYIAYQSSLNYNTLIIKVNNKEEILFKDETTEKEVYKNKSYSLTINSSERIDDTPSEDQGEIISTFIIKNLSTNTKIEKEVYCHCYFF
ncbi:hypothetical protein ACFFLS_19245 [Flavobacterium procerum]|uniref:Uncharacterized protein n=1 Tax=Flavobacterium procerum TaxID=1455569 RepID=A0ABV6BUS3_9FLAO